MTRNYCKYSFNDLYKSAYGKNIPKNIFQNKCQNEINWLVSIWADIAKWHIKLIDGSDNIKYLAFAPTKEELYD